MQQGKSFVKLPYTQPTTPCLLAADDWVGASIIGIVNAKRLEWKTVYGRDASIEDGVSLG